MPAIADRNSSPFKGMSAAKRCEVVGSNGCYTPQKRRLRSDTVVVKESPVSTTMKLKSPRRRLISSPSSPANQIEEDLGGKQVKKCWNPRDVEQMRAVKEALHVSTAPSTVVCREDEQKKILGMHQSKKKITGSTSPLQHLQNMYSNKQEPSGSKMICILIGIANSIDLADRFLPRLQSLNCKPMVVTFRAYSKDQILSILQERLLVLPYIVFHQQALELCARKVASASGDMRKALSVCRSAVEILEAELRESASNSSLTSEEGEFISPQTPQENSTVRIDHMALALSKTFRSPVVDTIQSLPHHQQIILCSAVKYFRGGKKDTTIGELNKSYIDICKLALIPPVGILEFSSMCRVLNDQGLFKLGQSRDDKFKRVTLKVDEADISFALQGVRLFRNCLQ